MASDKHCFVIMPFSETTSNHTAQYWDSFFSSFIKPTVTNIGYSCKRSSAEPGNIMNAIVNELVTSDIVLAVLTDYNPNVWYELGTRHALKNGTIMMIEKGQDLPFDISQYGVIKYADTITEAKKFEENLRNSIHKIESQITDSPVRDFMEQYETNFTAQKEKKTYEEKLEKIYQFIQGLQQDRQISPAEAREYKYSMKDNNILWVDDNPSNNESIIDMYRLQGVKFDLVINTTMAIDFLASKNYNLVISDMGRGLEHDAGVRLLREIKFRIASPPPVFIFTNFNAIEKFGEIAKHENAMVVTASVRELIMNINDVLRRSSHTR